MARREALARSLQLNFAVYLLKTCCQRLDLLLLLTQLRRKILLLLRNCLLLFRRRGLEFLDLAMLFKKFIEQYNVDCFVANGSDLVIVVANNEFRIYLPYLLGDQAELNDTVWVEVFFVVEGDRFELKG